MSKYPEINTADEANMLRIQRQIGTRNVAFVALEKVHGSNFSFKTDGVKISYFSRNGRVMHNHNFMGKNQWNQMWARDDLLILQFPQHPPVVQVLYPPNFGGQHRNDSGS